MQRVYTVSWSAVFDLVFLHVMGIAGIGYAIVYPDLALVVWAGVLYVLGGLAVTVGAHRYFTHHSFKVRAVIVYGMALLFNLTGQGTIKDWVTRHLQHHGNEDVPGKDPHTPVEGFWHSFALWTVRKESCQIMLQYQKAVSRDDLRCRVIAWENRYHLFLTLSMVFALPATIGAYYGDWLGGLLVVGFARMLILSYVIWSVNSVGHRFGTRIKEGSSATNYGDLFHLPILAILTLGEAWHGNHHKAPCDWRLGREWWQIDPGKYFIQLLMLIGLAEKRV